MKPGIEETSALDTFKRDLLESVEQMKDAAGARVTGGRFEPSPAQTRRGAALMQALQALGEVDAAFVAALEAARVTELDAPLPVHERKRPAGA
ncbi:MAG: hypothetical protein Q8R75_00635 [Methyloversatilis sp.]|nr:hypothetical protein [Methyloversatilis sp.]MDP3576513.1 hypothetical protein [Methyloversatilis sp.]